jgi:hypothetical protein
MSASRIEIAELPGSSEGLRMAAARHGTRAGGDAALVRACVHAQCCGPSPASAEDPSEQDFADGPCWTRTSDLGIKSPLLYQLS